MKILCNDDVMPIGKYQGKTIQDIIAIDPEHIKQFDNNRYAISDTTLGALHDIMGRHSSYVGDYKRNLEPIINLKV
jgi:uncharacterized protein (DUF3820 family)